MEVLILNASPRAPKSNSKKYASIFSKYCKVKTSYHNISKTNHLEICSYFENYSDVLLVFPLYADAIPVTLLNFFKTLEKNPPENKPTVSVLINCGFIEHYQNDVAIKMVKLFCKENSFKFGSVLKIGSGEAILETPFKILAVNKIKKLSKSITNKKYAEFKVTMPLTKNMFVKASTSYWISLGNKNSITKEQMETMKIEDK